MMFPKEFKYRSKKYRDAAKDQPCTLRLPCCNGRTDTTVLAHRNGAGMGTKASDVDAADCCFECHEAYDNRSNREYHEVAKLVFEEARIETIINRVQRGILK